MEFRDKLKETTKEISYEIESFLPAEEGFQKIIFESANYSVRNGGKRLRPLLMRCAYILCRDIKDGGADAGAVMQQGSQSQTGQLSAASDDRHEISSEERSALLPFMAAMEMIHSSSLVHDDLPCMDNDTLRRGVPSTWAKFGEDFGTLAGDALMIYAFETAAKSTAAPELKVRCMEILAKKSGIYGMIGGQTVDVQLAGKQPTREQLEFIYKTKTGALIEACFMMGAVLAGADDETIARLERAAACIGMAFQIQDDILDVTSTEAELGKPIGSDEANGKITWLTFYGLEQSRKDVRNYTDEAISIIKGTGSYEFLEQLLISLVDRKF